MSEHRATSSRNARATSRNPQAQFEILVDGTPRSYRDTKLTAMGAGHFLKMRAPHSEVVVKDLQPES